MSAFLSLPPTRLARWGNRLLLGATFVVAGVPALLVLPLEIIGKDIAYIVDTRGPTGVLPLAVLAIVALAPLGFLWLFLRSERPLTYTIEGGVLTVPAHFGSVKVRLKGAKARRSPLTGALRLGGTGLPGVLMLGAFWGSGRFLHCAASSLKEGWLIEGDRTVYVSPIDNDGFAAALREAGVQVAA